MKIFNFLDHFLTKLVEETVSILRYVFFFVFGGLAVQILWKTGTFTRVVLIFFGLMLITVSATTTYCKLKQNELDKQLEEAANKSKELQHRKENLLDKVSNFFLFREFISKSDDAGKDSQKPI
jgi:hypothetical protein